MIRTASTHHSQSKLTLKDALRAASSAAAPAAAVDGAKSEDELFAELYVSGSKEAGAESPVPRFHYKLPSDDNVLSQKLREESRARFLERRNAELLDHDELKTLMDELANVSSPPIVHEKAMLNYTDFKKVSQHCGEKCRSFFTAKVFAKLLQKDPYGRISVDDFFNYVMKKVWMQQTRVSLSFYDASGQGYLREADLESYIKDLIPTLPQINGIEQTFHSFYVCTALRKFCFFLDPLRTGRIKIQDILCCPFLDDLTELRSDKLTSTDLDTNWFSATSALKVYGDYLHLDKTHNGMLSKSELARYGKGTLTQAFIDRVFQECQTYDGDIDYKTYLDLVLALENRKEPQALQFFFRILDINGRGYLDVFSLNYFFRDIQEQMRKHEQEPVKFEDVKDEIFDMVKPEDPCKITLKDLIRCGKGSTVVSILIDVNEFWAYDNRDTLAADV
uniref:Protein phosphatase 2 regulatory subunit n=1 Tax=Rhipicephalus zambeziensis TaxID=60191 RepID=A0A224Z6X7_9ACAR